MEVTNLLRLKLQKYSSLFPEQEINSKLYKQKSQHFIRLCVIGVLAG